MGAWKRLLVLELDAIGYQGPAAAKEARMSYGQLQKLCDNHIFRPSLKAGLAVGGPFPNRWSDDDVNALQTWNKIFTAGFRKGNLTKVGDNLRNDRPELATDGDYNNAAFANTNLEPIHGDVCEVTDDGRRISWLDRPGHEVCLDQRLFEGFVETVFLEEIEYADYHPDYLRNCRRRLRHYILVKLGHLLLAEITSEDLDDYLEWLGGVEPRFSNTERKEHVDLIGRVLRSARMKRHFTSQLPEKPPIPRSRLPQEIPSAKEIKNILALLCHKRDSLPGIVWVLLQTVVGLADKELLALQWLYVGERDIEAQNIFVRRKGVRRATTSEARSVPLPAPLVRLLRKLKDETEFNDDRHFVFADRTGDQPFNRRGRVSFYERYIYPVTDKIGLPRHILVKLQRVAAVLGAEADLKSEQIKNVLRIGTGEGRGRFQRPTQADVEAVRVAVETVLERVLPDELMDSPKPDRTDETVEISQLAAGREDRLQAFIEKRGCTITTVREKAKVHKPQFQDWRKGKLPDSSTMSVRIEEVLSGKVRI